MQKNTHEDYLSNLIDSMLINLEVSDTNFVLIKHYNTLDLSRDYIVDVSEKRSKAKFMYHSFEAGEMLGAYEPFLDWVKQLYYELSNEPLDVFFEKCNVYSLHRNIYKSYFETGVCKRKEEVLINEIEYEQKRFAQEIARMLGYLSNSRPLVIVLNRLHFAGKSTIRFIYDLLLSKYAKNIAFLATYNEIITVPEYMKGEWSRLIEKFDSHDCIIDWTWDSNSTMNEGHASFAFNPKNISDYFMKLNNMYNMLTLDQAIYYLDIMYHKFEVEKLYLLPKYKFVFLEIYAKIAMSMDKTSDALLYCDGMRLLMEESDNIAWEFKYNFTKAQIIMNGFQQSSADKYISKCKMICKKIGNPFLEFKTNLLEFLNEFSGWRNIWLLMDDKEVPDTLIEDCRKYEYYNHLAYIYVYSFDHSAEKYSDISKLDEELPNYNYGVELAKRLGNEYFLITAYKKNVMEASTNGYFDVSNYFYGKCYDIVIANNDLFEEAGIYNGMGYNCSTIEKYAKANEYFNKALVIYSKLNEMDYMAETLYNMAINCILAEEYAMGETYLSTCIKVCKLINSNGIRVCNLSKIYGLRAYCNYKLKIMYSCMINVQYVEQYLGRILEAEERDACESHLWDDDIFLYFFMSGLLDVYENNYEDAYIRFHKARKYMERYRGSEFLYRVPYSVELSNICRKLGKNDEAQEVLMEAMEFCESKGYIYKKELVKSCMEEKAYSSIKWNLSFKGMSIEEILEMATEIGLNKRYEEQRNKISFLNIWQKFINNDEESIDKMLNRAIVTFKNNYGINELTFIRLEDDKPVIRYDDSSYNINQDKVNYLVRYFTETRVGFSTTRLDKGYIEHKEFLEKVFGSNSISSFIFVPIFVNEKLSGLFIGCILMRSDWNHKVKRYSFSESDESIINLVFRQLMDAIERTESRLKIEKINDELQFVNGRLKQLAVCDMLTGLYNRQGFNEELETYIYKYESKKKKMAFAFFYADLDNFKFYNDTFGHDIGDLILVEFSSLIKRISNDRGYAVRYGGDEFIMVLYSDNRDELEAAAKEIYAVLKAEKGFKEKITQALGKPVDIPEKKYVSCSVGIAQATIDVGEDAKEVISTTLKHADEMMYYVKKTTKHRYVFYEDIKNDVAEFMATSKKEK